MLLKGLQNGSILVNSAAIYEKLNIKNNFKTYVVSGCVKISDTNFLLNLAQSFLPFFYVCALTSIYGLASLLQNG